MAHYNSRYGPESETTETETEPEVQNQRNPPPKLSAMKDEQSVPLHDFHGKPLPSIEGKPYQMKDTVISLPEGEIGSQDYGRREPTKQTQSRSIPTQSQDPGRSSRGGTVDIVVFFMDKTGLNLKVEDGQHTKAGDLFEMVLAEMPLPEAAMGDARDIFSLWLVSDLLELQLKPNHVPFKLVCYWEELLEKYTTAKDYDIERDEPVIMFQRNVFLPRSREQTVRNAEILRLLYYEAKENVVDARYPLTQSECDELAGLQALIHFTHFKDNEHTKDYYKSMVTQFYPEYLCKSKWSLGKKKSPVEERLVASHRAAFAKYGNLNSDKDLTNAYQGYLRQCWKKAYYGAAYFRAQVEHPGGKLRLRSHTDDPVYVAINTDGVFIIDLDDVEFLLGLLYKECAWEYAEPRDKENVDCIPCLFLQFRVEGISKLLQVFSREASLMDSLIEACVKLKEQRKAQGGLDSVDGVVDDDGIIESDKDTWAKFNRLCLTTLDNQGKIVSSDARMPSK